MNLKIKDFFFLILIFYLSFGNSLITKNSNLITNSDLRIENYKIELDTQKKKYNLGILILEDELFEFSTNEYSNNIYNQIITFNTSDNLILLIASLHSHEIVFLHDKKLNKYFNKKVKKDILNILKGDLKNNNMQLFKQNGVNLINKQLIEFNENDFTILFYLIFCSLILIACYSINKVNFNNKQFNKKSVKLNELGYEINKNEIKSSIKCAICLDNIINIKSLEITTCNHLYHKNCLHAWINKKDNCPMCRNNISLNDSSKFAKDFFYISNSVQINVLRIINNENRYLRWKFDKDFGFIFYNSYTWIELIFFTFREFLENYYKNLNYNFENQNSYWTITEINPEITIENW